ncbi:MAG: WecB/TagA/CpsF family glycosyltransferase [Parvularculaceae bacterium]
MLNGAVEAAGHLNPGFGDIEQMSADHIIDAITEAKADFVLVALGAAKGECWIEKNRDRLNAPVIAHLGAVVDFAAGAVARAPVWVRKTGLEWAWRIKEDPSLWRRYWQDGAGLAWLAMASPPGGVVGGAARGGRAGARRCFDARRARLYCAQRRSRGVGSRTGSPRFPRGGGVGPRYRARHERRRRG